MIRPDVSGVNADVPVVNTDFQSYLFKRQYAYVMPPLVTVPS